MRYSILFLLIFSLVSPGCARPVKSAPEPPGPFLPDLGPAPELSSQEWLNAPQPLRLANLRGKVVLLDMWTFGCINCRNVVPSLIGWHEKYASSGLVIIGNHYPEFAYKADFERLEKAAADLKIPYAIAADNHGDTWQAYNTRYWPTIYLIDKNGRLRFSRIGEGGYTETESAIQILLAETVKNKDEK